MVVLLQKKIRTGFLSKQAFIRRGNTLYKLHDLTFVILLLEYKVLHLIYIRPCTNLHALQSALLCRYQKEVSGKRRELEKKYANYYYDKVKKKEFLISPHAIDNVRGTRFHVKTDAAAIQKNMHNTTY